MQLEIGKIVEGKVVKITKFGVFVEIAPKINGLVHISEISDLFVNNIENFLCIGEIVKVKVLSYDNNKIGLSIKQAQTLKPKIKQEKSTRWNTTGSSTQNPAIFSNIIKKTNTNLTFEEMLNQFKKNSEEKLSTIKKRTDNHNNSYSKRH